MKAPARAAKPKPAAPLVPAAARAAAAAASPAATAPLAPMVAAGAPIVAAAAAPLAKAAPAAKPAGRGKEKPRADFESPAATKHKSADVAGQTRHLHKVLGLTARGGSIPPARTLALTRPHAELILQHLVGMPGGRGQPPTKGVADFRGPFAFQAVRALYVSGSSANHRSSAPCRMYSFGDLRKAKTR